MVGPVVQMVDEDGNPSWLRPLLKTCFFASCPVHGVSNKSECNMYCLQCMGDALCSSCLAHHKDHHVVQIRKSSYQDVIKASDVSKMIDISCVQTYIINSARVVFLKERPQPRPGKGGGNACKTCCRSLGDAFRFCSLGCKVGGMNPELTFAPGPKPDDDDYLSGSETGKPQRRMATASGHCNGRKSRRKGIPRRAPLRNS